MKISKFPIQSNNKINRSEILKNIRNKITEDTVIQKKTIEKYPDGEFNWYWPADYWRSLFGSRKEETVTAEGDGDIPAPIAPDERNEIGVLDKGPIESQVVDKDTGKKGPDWKGWHGRGDKGTIYADETTVTESKNNNEDVDDVSDSMEESYGYYEEKLNEKYNLIKEEIVNPQNKGTMSKSEISRRDRTATKVKAKAIKGKDTEENARYRLATYITLQGRGKSERSRTDKSKSTSKSKSKPKTNKGNFVDRLRSMIRNPGFGGLESKKNNPKSKKRK